MWKTVEIEARKTEVVKTKEEREERRREKTEKK